MTEEKSKNKGKEKETADEAEPRLYELGYHLASTVSPDAIGAEVSRLKDLVESHGGAFVADEMPKHVSLAYPMARVISGKREWCHTASFGWMKFRTTPEEALALKELLKTDEKILRFLLIKTAPEKAPAPKRMAFMTREKGPARKEEEKKKDDGKQTLSEEDLDKTIEELVVE